MEKEQFDGVVELWKELSEYLHNISSRLSGMDNCLESVLDELEKIRKRI